MKCEYKNVSTAQMTLFCDIASLVFGRTSQKVLTLNSVLILNVSGTVMKKKVLPISIFKCYVLRCN